MAGASLPLRAIHKERVRVFEDVIKKDCRPDYFVVLVDDLEPLFVANTRYSAKSSSHLIKDCVNIGEDASSVVVFVEHFSLFHGPTLSIVLGRDDTVSLFGSESFD